MSGDRARNGSFSGDWGYGGMSQTSETPSTRSREDLNTKGKTGLVQRCCVNEIP